MVLAAGLGTRMRPLTETTAKPLLRLGGRTLLDHALVHLADAGVETAVINAFWQAAAVADHLSSRPPPPRTVLLREVELLETGGGVRAALPLLGDKPFYVVNGDAFWLNGPISALLRLAPLERGYRRRAARPPHVARARGRRLRRFFPRQVGHTKAARGTRGRALHIRWRAADSSQAAEWRARGEIQHEQDVG